MDFNGPQSQNTVLDCDEDVLIKSSTFDSPYMHYRNNILGYYSGGYVNELNQHTTEASSPITFPYPYPHDINFRLQTPTVFPFTPISTYRTPSNAASFLCDTQVAQPSYPIHENCLHDYNGLYASDNLVLGRLLQVEHTKDRITNMEDTVVSAPSSVKRKMSEKRYGGNSVSCDGSDSRNDLTVSFNGGSCSAVASDSPLIENGMCNSIIPELTDGTNDTLKGEHDTGMVGVSEKGRNVICAVELLILKALEIVDAMHSGLGQVEDKYGKELLSEVLKAALNIIADPTFGTKNAATGIRNSRTPGPHIVAHPDDFKNPSSFLEIYGDPRCMNRMNGKRVSPVKDQSGNWACTSCYNVNYPRRYRCNKCQKLRDTAGDKIVAEYTRGVYMYHLTIRNAMKLQRNKHRASRYGNKQLNSKNGGGGCWRVESTEKVGGTEGEARNNDGSNC